MWRWLGGLASPAHICQILFRTHQWWENTSKNEDLNHLWMFLNWNCEMPNFVQNKPHWHHITSMIWSSVKKIAFSGEMGPKRRFEVPYASELMWMFWWTGSVKKPALPTRSIVMTVLTIGWLFLKSRKHLSAKCQKDLAANIQTWPLLVNKPATIKAGRKFDSYEQYLAHFMYCVPRLGWAFRPLQSASHARIPSMKSGCFSSNLSNACPQALLHSLECALLAPRARWRLATVLRRLVQVHHSD